MTWPRKSETQAEETHKEAGRAVHIKEEECEVEDVANEFAENMSENFPSRAVCLYKLS